MIAESFAPGAFVSKVAQRCGVNANLLFTWRRQEGRATQSAGRRRLCRSRTATRVRRDREQPFKATRRIQTVRPGIVFAPQRIHADAGPRWHGER
jgi:transposase-like protein